MRSKNYELGSGFTLVIAEKPDAGRRIANVLGETTHLKINNIEIQDVRSAFDGKHYVICAASGHLYGIHDRNNKRSVYPVFDVEWLPLNAILSKKRGKSRSRFQFHLASGTAKRIETIRNLSTGAQMFIHACDSDLEGETIGFNILRYACGVSEWNQCKRARFSTLTVPEIRDSFSHLEPIKECIAQAGCMRHVIDFLWGVNLSRALAGAYSKSSRGYHNITIGRVQGPALSFVADREVEIRTHVPVPYWRISALLSKDGVSFDAIYEQTKIDIMSEAQAVKETVSQTGRAKVKSVTRSASEEQPPFPFNLSDLQTEMFRHHGFTPSTTLKISEKLYLRALISYPRTNSQKLPVSIDYDRIINSIGSIQKYKNLIEHLASTRRHFPRQGPKDDAAHPAIYPTGEPPKQLSAAEAKVYDLIVRRFLATFANNAVISEASFQFLIGSNIFTANNRKILKDGWMKIYPVTKHIPSNLPDLKEGDLLKVLSVALESEFERPLVRFTQSSLLKAMEGNEIGTKATRADIISKMIGRGYMTQGNHGYLEASEIGLELTDAMRTHCEEIISVDLTRSVESEIEQIAEGKADQTRVLDLTKVAVSLAVDKIKKSEVEIGAGLANAVALSRSDNIRVGQCPVCSNGGLRIVKSSKTGKRFIGCSNYENGCNAAAPLPQKGTIKVQTRTCPSCKWPLVTVLLRSRSPPWVICPNISCSGRKQE